MTPEQLREHAKQWDDDGRYSIGEVFRAHADALEELARLKAPLEGEIAAVCGMLDGYISNALPGIDTVILRRSRALIESLAFQYPNAPNTLRPNSPSSRRTLRMGTGC